MRAGVVSTRVDAVSAGVDAARTCVVAAPTDVDAAPMCVDAALADAYAVCAFGHTAYAFVRMACVVPRRLDVWVGGRVPMDVWLTGSPERPAYTTPKIPREKARVSVILKPPPNTVYEYTLPEVMGECQADC
jgi:hypothetical protein